MSAPPSYVTDLQAVYGLPSQAGFGSAVFYEPSIQADQLEAVALRTYRHFVGDLWERWGADAWMSPWQCVYQRDAAAPGQVVAELRAITDADAALSASMILEVDPPETTHRALAAAYDAETITNFEVYTLGDGAAMSGLLLAGRRATGEATFLIFLLD